MGRSKGIRIQSKIVVLFIGLLFFCFTAEGMAQLFGSKKAKETKKETPVKTDQQIKKADPAQTKRLARGVDSTAKIYLSEREDLIYVGLHSYQSLWFRVPKSVKKPIDGEFKLYFTFSTILIPNTSNITITINDIPIKSITLENRDPENSEESFTVSAGFLKEGMNHLRIQLYAQANVDECKDIDNPANWYVIKKESALHLHYDSTPSQNLATFPEPLLRMESFSQNGLAFVMPEKPSTSLIEAYTNTAKQLGALSQETSDDVVIHATGIERPNTQLLKSDERAIEKVVRKSDLVVLGKQSDLPFGLKKEYPIGKDLAQYALDLSPWSDQAVIFSISADDERTLKPAVNVMVSDILRRKLKGKEKIIDPYYAPYTRKSLADIFSVRRTFENLGYGDEMIRGSFYNESSYYFSIPASWRLKKNAALNFVLDMSPLLVQNQSEMSVFVNGLFANSSKLTGDRQNSKIIRVELPPEVLLDKAFDIIIRLYLDIGQKGCERRFPEKAWVLLHKESYVSLPHVDKTGLKLKDFPAAYMLNNQVSLPIIIIPDEPDHNALSALYRFAYTLGQFLPVAQDWLIVKRVSEITDEDLKENLIVLGRAETNSFFSRINPDLPISFNLEDSKPFILRADQKNEEEFTAGEFKGDYQWNLPADFRGDIGCIEMIDSPWDEEKSLTVITGTAEFLLLDAVDVIRDRGKLALIDSKIAIVSSEGSVIAYSDKVSDSETVDLQRDALRAKLPIFVIIVVTAIFAIVISIYFMQKK